MESYEYLAITSFQSCSLHAEIWVICKSSSPH
jgi:hypothetical protein